MTKPGYVLLLGSGETSPNIRKAYNWLFEHLTPPVRTAILETPAGFEPNSEYVAAQIAKHFEKRLQNFKPRLSVIPARKKGTDFSPDDPALLNPMLQADVIFTGPGSPTYAVKQLQDSLAWQTLLARHRLGANLIFASAASLAVSSETLPVYEIYKVGTDLHWQVGLDFFGPYGLKLVFIPHWNNQEGGEKLDTSRCYMGQTRYEQLRQMLPHNRTVVGLDENTALIFDLATQTCHVMGLGAVTILRRSTEMVFRAGETFAMQALGDVSLPPPRAGIPAAVWNRVEAALSEAEDEVAPPPTLVDLLNQRQAARAQRDWPTADALRDAIEAEGWRVLDTPQGPVLEKA